MIHYLLLLSVICMTAAVVVLFGLIFYTIGFTISDWRKSR